MVGNFAGGVLTLGAGSAPVDDSATKSRVCCPARRSPSLSRIWRLIWVSTLIIATQLPQILVV